MMPVAAVVAVSEEASAAAEGETDCFLLLAPRRFEALGDEEETA